MKRYRFLLLAAALLVAFSCQRQEPDAGEGMLSLGIEMDPSTKAALSSDQLLASSKVNIYYADFSGLVRSYTYSQAPETIWLPANAYRVDVIAGEASKASPAPASWEQKSYKGSAEFAIAAGKNTSVKVNATVGNAISKVSFDPSVAENFAAGYTLKIGTAKGELTYTAANSGAEGYFIIDGMDDPEFSWTFNGTLSKNGSAFTKSGKVSGLSAGKVYSMTIKYTVKDGLAAFDLYVDYTTEVVDDTIVFEPVSTGLAASSPYEIWAAHATVHADVDETENPDPSAIRFAYSSDSQNWKSVAANRVSEGVYDAVLTGLAPSTEYTYKLVISGADAGEPMSFTTEAAPAVPNGDFEVTSDSYDGNYKEWYNPSSSDPLCKTAWWGSGNGSDGISGSAAYKVICKPDTGDKVSGSQSALLCSEYAVVKFAAGNLFTGYFAGLVGTKGGRVNFGRPFTARPTALKFWAKYSAGTITDINGSPSGVDITTSDYDCGRVQVALGTWDRKTYGGTNDSPVQVNTTDYSTFIDYTTDKSTIAYGEKKFQSDSSDPFNKWVEYTIPLDYRNMTAYPTHIIISCAASMYGDYFTGCRTAKLWIDKMEFVYE